MKILITGATGFIGKAVGSLLEQCGHDLVSVSLSGWWRNGLPAEVDAPYDAIIHCAWGGVDAAGRNDFELQQQNIDLFSQLLHRSAMAGTKAFISFGSQAEIYQPETHYGAAKLECQRLMKHVGELGKMRCVWLQLFSVYGEGQGEQWLIPGLIRKLLANLPIDLTPGDQRMDFLHVRDVALAVLSVLTCDVRGVYEVGSGHEHSLLQVAEFLHALTFSSSLLNWGAIPYRADQVMLACADPYDFHSATGWQPRTDFIVGLRDTIKHIKAHV